MAISLFEALSLSGLGLLAGIINTIAGGGSNLTIPALMMLGMPPDIANATNRVGVLLQGVTASHSFLRHRRLPLHDIVAIMLPLLIGGLFGSLFASLAPAALLKYLMLGSMIAVALIILLRPNVIAPVAGTIPLKVKEAQPKSLCLLLIAGFYGGFVQAGVGFILITTFAGVLRYDMVASNALKVFATVFFTAVSLLVFIINDQVRWVPGLILAAGTMLGALIGVKLAINISQKTMKWCLLIMTIVASVAALLK